MSSCRSSTVSTMPSDPLLNLLACGRHNSPPGFSPPGLSVNCSCPAKGLKYLNVLTCCNFEIVLICSTDRYATVQIIMRVPLVWNRKLGQLRVSKSLSAPGEAHQAKRGGVRGNLRGGGSSPAWALTCSLLRNSCLHLSALNQKQLLQTIFVLPGGIIVTLYSLWWCVGLWVQRGQEGN